LLTDREEAERLLEGELARFRQQSGRGDSAEMQTIIMVQSAARDLEAGFTATSTWTHAAVLARWS
jgi:hypothetical protein